MPKQRKTYTKEFKLEAVRLVLTSRKTMSHIARDLGVSDSALYHWCKQWAEQIPEAFPSSGHQTAEQEKLLAASMISGLPTLFQDFSFLAL
jgi:transposase